MCAVLNYMGIPGIKEEYRAERKPKITPERIIKVVCDHLDVDADGLKGKCRVKDLVYARHIIFYFLRKHTSVTLKIAGELFNRDHTTVVHGLKYLQDLIDTEPLVRSEIELMETALKER